MKIVCLSWFKKIPVYHFNKGNPYYKMRYALIEKIYRFLVVSTHSKLRKERYKKQLIFVHLFWVFFNRHLRTKKNKEKWNNYHKVYES